MAKFSQSHMVCQCNQVILGEIIHAIKDRGANSISDIKRLTDAGNTCGCCISSNNDVNEKKMDLYLSQILDKFKKS